MVEFKFYINGTEVEEPLNWAEVEFQVERDSVYFGLERKVSLQSVELWGEGRRIVKQLIDTYGINAEASFEIHRLNYDFNKYELFAPNIISFEEWTEKFSPTEGDTIELKLLDSNINSKTSNREKNELIIGDAETIDGTNTSLLSRQSLDVLYKSRGIKNIAELPFSGPFSGIPNTSNPSNTFREMKHTALGGSTTESNIPFLQNPVEEGPLDITALTNPAPFSGFEEMTQFQLLFTESADNHSMLVDYSFTAEINGLATISSPVTFNNLRFRVYEVDFDGTTFSNPNPIHTNTFSIVVNPLPFGTGGFGETNVSSSFSFTKQSGKSYFLSLDALGQNWGLGYTGGIDGTISFDYDTYIEDGNHKSVFIYQCLLSLLEQMTGIPGVLYSETYGKPSDGYDEYGIYSKIVATNGLFLRNAVNSDGTQVELVQNFKDLFTTLTAIHGLAVWYNSETEQIHIETRDRAFGGDEIEVILENIEKSLASEFLFTSVKVGNDPVEYENVNGANEFNMTMDFNTNLNIKSKTLSLVTKYNTDYLGIELARLNQFDTTANVDTKYDDKVFLVEVEEVGGVWQTRMGSTYPVVSGIPLPDTAGNIAFSPKRMLERNSDLIVPSYWKQLSEELKFKKASNLAAMTSKDEVAGPFIVERANLIGSDMTKLFLPIEVSGEIPKRDIWKIFQNQNVVYTFTNGCETLRGFLWSAKVQNDVANVKFLLKWE